MGDSIPSSYRQIVQGNQEGLRTLIDNGAVKPFLLYHLLIYTGLPVLALLVPERKGSKYVRPVIFALILSIAIEVISYRRTILGANGYIVGLMISWWVFWCAALLIFTDPEKDFKRIERKPATSINDQDKPQAVQNENGAAVNEDTEIFNWNGTTRSTSGGTACSAELCRSGLSACHSLPKQSSNQHEQLEWQGYPHPFLHRTNWTLGLLLNMRGPEWNWRIPTLEPLPKTLHLQLNPHHSDKSCEKAEAKYATGKVRLIAAFRSFLKSYLCLDLAKSLMMRDPYFWGVIPAPPPFPFNYLAGYPILVSLYRLHLVAFGIVAALSYTFSFCPIIFLGLSLTFPNASKGLTSVPLDAPWLYSDLFGPFIAPVLDNGLAGCWGQWWHQVFRFGFTSPARWFLSLLPSKLSSNRQFRHTIMAFFAFTISGTLHACGSYTQFADTKPLSGSFLYFFLQAVGVLIQNVFAKVILPKTSPCEFPRWVKRAGNFAFSYTWLMMSGPLIADEFAKGGVWLTEPVPISFLRGLGFMGNKDEGWWCWHGPWFRY
ncbi:hypothetical protein PHISCL_04338 [Aspergillus sclerotialis]|uniref:Wax synthase domain-containing protein n=1 Tax=Aspergillus sclerotialis TaxID=2070753 RepID=A0A3A2ZJF6_9EURO|nr:hypothetical protein PHISCL_04338 [Aspergillus sclerotialis]